MSNGGNAYVLPSSDIITDIRLRGREYSILDQRIPFWAIAVHGRLPFTARPINISGDWREELLLSAEHGAGLSFTVMAQDAKELQDTDYTHLYGASFNAWKDAIKGLYKEYNAKLGGTFNTGIIGHKRYSDTITKTTFGNGTAVYVNYGYEDAVVDGLRIAARDFVPVQE